MVYTIKNFKVDVLNKRAGGTWNKYTVKLVETGEVAYELNFGKYIKEKLAIGQKLNGYISERSWTGQNGTIITKVFNAIDADYLYSLILKMNPNIEGVKTPTVEAAPKESQWETTGPADEPTPDNNDW
jgi:hypothetical protein